MADGVEVVSAALLADAPLLTVVQPDNIAAGPLPIGTSLPALAVNQISQFEMATVAGESLRHIRSRVQVTVHAGSYPALRDTLALVRRAGDWATPEVAGISDVKVQADGQGPDTVDEQGRIFSGSQDFLVHWNETT